MEFTEKEFSEFKADVEKSLQSVGKKHGLVIRPSILCYGYNEFDLRLNAVKVDDANESEKERFAQVCGKYGFSPDAYGHKVLIEDKFYRIIGFHGRAMKNHVVLQDIKNGTTCRMDLPTVANAYALAKKRRCRAVDCS